MKIRIHIRLPATVQALVEDFSFQMPHEANPVMTATPTEIEAAMMRLRRSGSPSWRCTVLRMIVLKYAR
jgi:hypothetical protein